MKYIYLSSEGYRVDIRKSGIRLTKRFSFRDFGGDITALSQALAWRNEQHERSFGYTPNDGLQRYGLKRTNSPSFYKELALPPRVTVEYFSGKAYYFTVTIKKQKFRFSISKLGEYLAYERAIKLVSSNHI